MADTEKKKGGLVMGLIVPLLVIGLAGIGAGFGLSGLFAKPTQDPALAAKTADATAAAPAAPAPAKEKEKPVTGDKKAEKGEKDSKASAAAEAEAHASNLLADQQKAMVIDMKDTTFVPLTPVIANLASPNTSWIRLEGSLAVKKMTKDKPADIVNLVAPKILDYLKTLSLEQVQGADNLAFLNMDLNEIVRSSTNGQASAVLVTGFVIE